MIISDKHIDVIINIAKLVFTNPVEIWAFGSRVSGSGHEGSDLDIVIKSKSKSNWKEIAKFKHMLHESNIPFLIDILIWDLIPEGFKNNILEDYEVLVNLDPHTIED